MLKTSPAYIKCDVIFHVGLSYMTTWKQKFNIKYGQPKDKSNSLREIAKLSGYRLSGLQTIVQKGRAAFFNDRDSVRPHVKDPTHWGLARAYSAVMGGPAARIDKKHLVKVR